MKPTACESWRGYAPTNPKGAYMPTKNVGTYAPPREIRLEQKGVTILG